jgi:glycerol uptake facilitator-like aquaporin
VNLARRLCAEGIGSLLLAAAVIGSGIMAERMAGGNLAVALLANTGATVAVLASLIGMLGPVSGAHFNPAISMVQLIRGRLALGDAFAYAAVQVAGCMLGAMLAHAMFELPLIQASTHARAGGPQWLSEAVATGGLVLVVLSCKSPTVAAGRVAAWIGGAYWFTASTSFANPAITIGRALTDTFAGIRPADAPGFIAAQVVGALAGLCLAGLLFKNAAASPPLSTFAKSHSHD